MSTYNVIDVFEHKKKNQSITKVVFTFIIVGSIRNFFRIRD